MQIHKRLKISQKERVGENKADEGLLSARRWSGHMWEALMMQFATSRQMERGQSVKGSAPLKHEVLRAS